MQVSHLENQGRSKPSRQKIPEPDNTYAEALRVARREHPALIFELRRFDPGERNIPHWRRTMRARAKGMIEGRLRWPKNLLGWKVFQELRYYHGVRDYPMPAWCDPRNLTRPQRDAIAREDRAWDQRFSEHDARRARIAEDAQ